MKKSFALLLALALFLLCPAALAAEFVAEGVFTITYDETAYTVDSTTYAHENTDDTYHWYCLIYNNDYAIDVTVYDMEDLAGVTLFTLEDEKRLEYVDFMLEAFEDDDIRYIGTLNASEYDIPFYFFTATDSEGQYLFAQTVVKGKAIEFAIYYNDASKDVDQSLLDALCVLVETFVPAA